MNKLIGRLLVVLAIGWLDNNKNWPAEIGGTKTFGGEGGI
jgi:hypothetical protein